jgi:hypothetical protein
MSIWIEGIELAAAALPAVLSFLLVRRRVTHIRGWFIQVIGTAFIAVIALGLLLMRLTRHCASLEVQCTPPLQLMARSPGLFSTCQWCAEPGSSQLSEQLNRWTIDLQAVSAAASVLLSSFIIIRFLVWARRTLLDARGQDS